ncbi:MULTISPECIES: hypothetical protein [Neptunomonas]|uniref:hypothetical protein n=1 Tax=Neptunomonas TaxID=75687 RepID=UPI0015C082BB|nr:MULTISPECIES: hypothetical protein [Neptunomonas]MDN2659804.1 hypothetical protein [Neptunomonas sp. CHC150]QLE97758.1 hypothetical protein FLM49_09025 [Neptunomonas phycophila]
MHTLNRVTEDSHYYLTPSQSKKAAAMLVKAAEEGELDYALGSLIQWGAKKLGRSITDKQKKSIDAVAKKAIPLVGTIASVATGKPKYEKIAKTVTHHYDDIEPTYHFLKDKISGLFNELDAELDFESATKVVNAVTQTLGTISERPDINTPLKIQRLLQSRIRRQGGRQRQSGRWYRQNGQVVLSGVGR